MPYYYFAATLPMLSFDAEPPFAFDRFVEICRTGLTEEDFAGLEEAAAAPEGEPSHPFACAWKVRETAIRNAVARQRGLRRQKDAGPFLRGDAWEAGIERGVAEAFGRESPLERETALDRLRWSSLDELAGLDMFSAGAVLAYGLKLRLSGRRASWKASRGRSRLGQFLETRT